MLGDGSGAFTDAPRVAAGGDPRAVDIGDLNNDGLTDLVTANASDNMLLLFLGDGTGNFSQSSTIDFEDRASPRGVAIGDLNGDDNADIAVALRSPMSTALERLRMPRALLLAAIHEPLTLAILTTTA